ncbi:MAG: DUF2147 domain-containing protein [Hyphomicrobiales bacterium]|nr:DUF2147 domain-containing protein [Hyphomicrobiales bacterium]
MKLFLRMMMPALGLALLAGFSPASQAGAEDAFGTWKDSAKGSVVRVYACGGGLCAQIVKTSDAGAKDVNNSNPALQKRPIAGLVIMSGAKKSGDNAWKGSIYNREDGQRYSGSLTVVSKNQLELQGCGLGGLVCTSRTWSRMN